MSHKIILGIVGASDLGQLIAYHAITYCGFTKVLFFDDYKKSNELVKKNLVYGNTNEVEIAYLKKEITHIIIGIGYKHIEFRKKIFERFRDKIPFASVIHPSAFIDKSCHIGDGVVILPGCILDMNTKIGDNVLLNTGCTLAHDSYINEHSFLSPSVSVAGFVNIGKCCNIGINTVIIDNIKISDFIQTGAATVVIKDLVEKGLYVGNPARFIR